MGINALRLSQDRSKNYLSQLKGSVLYKVGAIASTFLAMPFMIKYLGVEQFGIWATMLTLVTWVMLFDLGIGNGLKNKVSESLANEDQEAAVSYISTAYVLIGIISLLLFTIFLISSNWISWQSVFNTQAVSEDVLKNSVITLSFFIFFNFWISLVNQIYHGLQKSSVVVLGQFISNALALSFVLLLYFYTQSSIALIVWAYGISIIIANVALSFLVFRKYQFLKPKIFLFDRVKVQSLFSLGAKFFVIQLAVIVIFMSDKILITQLIGPEYVTSYEVLFKLFSILTITHGLILTPLWPAFSNAYANKDFLWIKRNMKNQLLVVFLIFLGAFVLSLVGPYLVRLWIGTKLEIDQDLFYFFSVYIMVSVWSNLFAYFVSSINELRLQIYTSVMAAIINIPLSIFLVKYFNFGVEGVVLATIISLSIFAIAGPFQVFKIINKN